MPWTSFDARVLNDISSSSFQFSASVEMKKKFTLQTTFVFQTTDVNRVIYIISEKNQYIHLCELKRKERNNDDDEKKKKK